MALTDKLTSIAEAIREKGGTTEKIKLDEMPQAILDLPSGGGGGVEPPEGVLNFTGNCTYKFSGGTWDWVMDAYGDEMSTNNITNANYMFQNSNVKSIPFDINLSTTTNVPINYLFDSCNELTIVPKIIGKVGDTSSLFWNCFKLREIPEEAIKDIDWSWHTSQTSAYSGSKNGMFSACYSLRKVPNELLEKANPNAFYAYVYFNGGFGGCYALDELTDLPIPYTAEYTSNLFNGAFMSCNRVNNITFRTPNGAPYTVNWKGQNIDLASSVGYCNSSPGNYTNHNSGITADKLVSNDEQYAALKDDPDWSALHMYYSRYNHDSAVATINSLPDTSAYLATAGGSNTIRFDGASGKFTDGGAINTLTSEEIAVAAAKGWTVAMI